MATLANMKQFHRDFVSWDFVDANQGAFSSNTLKIPSGQSNLSLVNATASSVTQIVGEYRPLGRTIVFQNPTSNTVTFTDTAFGSLSADGQLVLNGGNAAIGQGGTIALKVEFSGTYYYFTEIARNVGG